jgi:hypothetical protein
MNRWHIGPALKQLISRNIITISGTGYLLEYGIQKDYDKWKIVTNNGNEIVTNNGNDSLPKTVTKSKSKSLPILEKSLPKTVTKSLPISVHTNTIKQYTKETILPGWIKKETWDAFLEMRNGKKKYPTPYAQGLIIKELDRLRGEGEDPNAILEKSIVETWTAVYSLKGKGTNGLKPRIGQIYKNDEEDEKLK